MMAALNAMFLVAGLLANLAISQSTILNEQVLSSFIYTVYGDRTPLILSEEPTLTPLGAQQLYSVGQTFRNRYVGSNGSDTAGTAILGISPYILNNEAISILTTSDQYLVASATAFMQGLYPPLELSSSGTFATDLSALANGSIITAPLSNYRTLPHLATLCSTNVLHLLSKTSARLAISPSPATRYHALCGSMLTVSLRVPTAIHSKPVGPELDMGQWLV
jgi:hypothetical protein